jgi:hypothetical protein
VSIFPEGCSHRIDGIRDCAFSQESITLLRKLPLTHSHGKSSHDLDQLLLQCFIEENIVPESGLVVVFEVAVPRPSVVLVCVSANSGLTGNRSSSEVSQEVILQGRVTFLKFLESWEGQ